MDEDLYGSALAEWLASQQGVINGSGKVYTGQGITADAAARRYGITSEVLPGVLGQQYGQATYTATNNALLMGWQQIARNPQALSALSDVYRAHYSKPATYQPSANQLMSMYERAVRDASTEEANDAGITVSDVLNGYAAYGIFGGNGPGSGGPGSGPTSFVTHRNEADVRILANALAEEMIGRSVNDKEFTRMMRRVRKAEDATPQTVSGNGGTRVTNEGVSDAQRQEVLQEVLREKPEWERYQMTTGILDAMSESMRNTEAMDSGI